MRKIKSVGLAFGVLIASIGQSFCQTNLQFTAVAQTDEQAIHLAWASQSNHVYQIQCANALNTNADGSTAWQVLYDDYPSQGTNTFWLDTGNYDFVPAIMHPKNSPMRFYRIVDKGADGLVGNEPAISIVSPADGSVVSGALTITVSVSAYGEVFVPRLYVDGQVMWPSEDGSNYVINTSEWGNGPHVLFATVNSSTAIDGPMISGGVAGHGVSPFVNVTFSNLISRISFSQQFFQPALGQTQQVSAVFAANCDWTLNIVDVYSNVVKTATGSGTSMLYNWNGTDNSNNPVAAGVYYYYISAQTNGESSDDAMMSGERFSTAFDDSPELWAMPIDSSSEAVPFSIYPPGFDTNGLTIFSATPSEVNAAKTSVSSARFGDFSPADSGSDDYSGPSGQSASAAPARKPTDPIANSSGKFAIGFQMYSGNGTNPVYAPGLSDGSGIRGEDVNIYNTQGLGAGATLSCDPFNNVDSVAINFSDEMGKGGWQSGGFKYNDNLHLSDLQGSGTFFNQADIGLLILHGSYGLSYDYITGHPLYGIYFPIAYGTSAQYLRMTDMQLGGSSPTNGLKWMAILACDSLYQRNWNSMISQGAKPYNSNLHMILGTATEDAAEPLIGQYWADYMLGISSTKSRPAMPIRLAWYNAAYDAYQAGVTNGVGGYINPTTFAVEADPNCLNDYLQTQTNSVLAGGTWQRDTWTVYPPGNPPPTQPQ